jgi:hypothetical protein
VVCASMNGDRTPITLFGFAEDVARSEFSPYHYNLEIALHCEPIDTLSGRPPLK